MPNSFRGNIQIGMGAEGGDVMLNQQSSGSAQGGIIGDGIQWVENQRMVGASRTTASKGSRATRMVRT